jgi:methyltransferase (TIGR00027 family)
VNQPDSTAVTVALWRAAHLILDAPPHVLEDRFAIMLAGDAGTLRSAEFPVEDGAPVDESGARWLTDARMLGQRRHWRATVVARSRFAEDLVRQTGVGQYVVLGAGLDSFALRNKNAPSVEVFEVDEPATQAWKRDRLLQLRLASPCLHFAPVDFESGESWVEEIKTCGFDSASPAVVAMLGVSQYITEDAMTETMSAVASLQARSILVASFLLPIGSIEQDEMEMRRATEASAAARGHPWTTFYRPDEIASLARDAGLPSCHVVSPQDLTDSYFATREDGLKPSSSEYLFVASQAAG